MRPDAEETRKGPRLHRVAGVEKSREQKPAWLLLIAMKMFKSLAQVFFVPGLVTIGLLTNPLQLRAATLWNGPLITFTHSAATGDLADQLTPGVILTRGSSGGLYNSATESGATSGISPDDTEWAEGLLADYDTLTYVPCLLEEGLRPPDYVGTNFVVHLINEDIYLSLTLTAWGGAGGIGDPSFTYIRSTPAPAPAVTITNPAGGAVFAAPASLKLGADASVSGGTVTNVQFFANTVALGSVGVAPFNLTAGSLAAGAYSLTAVATAAGISATSPVVNVSVVNPVAVRLSAAGLKNNQVTFQYAVNAGLSYVVQRSTNLVNWVSLATNVAAGNPAGYTNPVSSTGAGFYRVGRMPNP